MLKSVIHNSLFVILPLLVLVSSGCHKRSTAETPAPKETPAPPKPAPPAVAPEVTYPSATPAISPEPSAKATAALNKFDLGEADFEAGKYHEAALYFDDFLKENPQSGNRDQVLFLRGLSRALIDNSSRNQRQSEADFRKVISEFPESPYRHQAEYILDLKTRIKKLGAAVAERDETIEKLSKELKKLKEIDLQRKPSRPD